MIDEAVELELGMKTPLAAGDIAARARVEIELEDLYLERAPELTRSGGLGCRCLRR
jgi:hypothetical protein